MNKDIDNYYKTCDFVYFDEKDRLKNYINDEYGYNIDSTKRKKNYLSDLTMKTKRYINKEYLDNYKK